MDITPQQAYGEAFEKYARETLPCPRCEIENSIRFSLTCVCGYKLDLMYEDGRPRFI